MSDIVNDNLVLVVGDSASGKSNSLENLENPEGVMYLNCESGKKLPFNAKFKQYVITDPYEVHQAFTVAESKPEIHTIVVDGLNYLMDMFESVHVLPSANTMGAWGDYGQFFKNLMQVHAAKSTKDVIFLAHTTKTLNEAEMTMESAVPVKGALKGKVESYFSTIVAAKRVPLGKLEGQENNMLTVTEDDKDLEYKYVFQTRVTKETIQEKMRGPRLMWSRKEIFIDNDCQKLLSHMREFYA